MEENWLKWHAHVDLFSSDVAGRSRPKLFKVCRQIWTFFGTFAGRCGPFWGKVCRPMWTEMIKLLQTILYGPFWLKYSRPIRAVCSQILQADKDLIDLIVAGRSGPPIKYESQFPIQILKVNAKLKPIIDLNSIPYSNIFLSKVRGKETSPPIFSHHEPNINLWHFRK